MKLRQLRYICISMLFTLVMSSLVIGGYDIVVYLSILAFVGGLILDDVSTVLVLSNLRPGTLRENNPLVRELMLEHGIVKGVFLSHFHPKWLFAIFFIWIYGAFSGLTLSIFYGVDISVSVIVTAGNSFVGMIGISASINNFRKFYLVKNEKGGAR